MKKTILITLSLLLSLSLFAQANVETGSGENTVTVYTYDTFSSEWGAGPELIPLFESMTGIKVNLVTIGDTGELINRVLSEGENTEADVILGIPDDMAYRLFDADVLSSYESPLLSEIDDSLEFDPEHRLLPFDYGVFGFVFDSESGITPPESLEDLTKPEYKDQIILIDPRTSPAGLGLLLWSYEIVGDDYLTWWKEVGENALTITDGWSSAYGLFTEGEAPLVISYTTSPVYHVLNENTTRYVALIFPEGHHGTIEGIGISKYAKNRENAEKFIDFLLTDGQETMAVLNSMYPANGSISLPQAYDYAPKPDIIRRSSEDVVRNQLSVMLDDWTKVMTE